MMKVRLAVLSAVAAIALSACGGGAPKGQVVAKVGKSEVTAIDLQSELQGFKTSDPKVRKAAEQQALNGIIQRKILAEAAKKAGIDKSPEFARQESRLKEALLVKTWQDNLVRAVPAPSNEEVQKFIAANPDLYSARKKIVIEGIRFAVPPDPTLIAALKPLNTLDEVTALLTERKVPFQQTGGQIDALTVDPRLTDQLLKLKPGAIFVMPQNNLILVGRIKEVKVEPVPDNIAVQHATQYLHAKATQEVVQRRFGALVQAGRANVKFSKAYEPAPAPKAGAPAAKPAAPAPAATPAAQKPG